MRVHVYVHVCACFCVCVCARMCVLHYCTSTIKNIMQKHIFYVLHAYSYITTCKQLTISGVFLAENEPYGGETSLKT